MKTRILTGAIVAMMLSACSILESEPFSYDCSTSTSFTPIASPVTYTASGSTTTVFVLHGKTGSPGSPHYNSLLPGLQSAGYDVIAPYMPWSSTTWNGTQCEGMNYLSGLIEAEKTAGKKVVLLGHSMGGAGALIYLATSNVSGVDAAVTIAPGHFLHHSNLMQSETVDSVSAAQTMVDAGNGDTNDTFYTFNNGTQQAITTTANIYLSYHDLNQYPNIVNGVLGVIETPVYWIGGDADNLTTAYGYSSIFNNIPSNPNSQYETLSGTHTSVVTNAITPITTWLGGQGL
ncbi:MAG: alpha/beta fold hydrolase [Gammaproteobacteria bacterium]|nr:alpha/beta fold hydrolase [Gammaproteobacteria bacterium]